MASLTSLLPLLLAATLSVIAVLVAGQDTSPATYHYDCRRWKMNCLNNGSCTKSGHCDCSGTNFLGYNCGLDPAESTECAQNQCENNAVCLNDSKCYCNKDTYGNKCENARIKVWCTDSQMVINVNPHGSEFAGMIYLWKSNDTGKNDSNCQLKPVTSGEPNLTQYSYVKTVQGDTPVLDGYYTVQDHAPAAGDGTGLCGAAEKVENSVQTVYIRQVIIEYDQRIVTKADQIVTFYCTISSTAETITSENAISVTLDKDDYQPTNATDHVVPVLFQIYDSNSGFIVTNDIRVGDPINLVFTLPTADGTPTETSIKKFKVTECFATNGQPVPAGESPYNKITFLTDDCGKKESQVIFRGSPVQLNNETMTIIPLTAFRFVGYYSTVAFTCFLKMCYEDTDTDCEIGCEDSSTESGVTTPPESGVTTQPESGVTTQPESGVTTQPESGVTTQPESGSGRKRRKRAANEERQNVTNSIKVHFPLGGSEQTGTDEGPEKEPDTEDCMQHSEVVIIIAIFAVILVLLVLALVIVIINLLRSRQKVVDATDRSVASPQSHYSLPRLSLATTM